jgi:hypothetical protein
VLLVAEKLFLQIRLFPPAQISLPAPARSAAQRRPAVQRQLFPPWGRIVGAKRCFALTLRPYQIAVIRGRLWVAADQHSC